MKKIIPALSAALFGVAIAVGPAMAQGGGSGLDKSGSATHDKTGESTNYTGKGRMGSKGAPADAGPSQNAGGKTNPANNSH